MKEFNVEQLALDNWDSLLKVSWCLINVSLIVICVELFVHECKSNKVAGVTLLCK